MVRTIEQGDIYFFYRNKVDVDRASDIGDIQRTYMILAPDSVNNGRKARLFVIGKKRLPEIVKGEAKPNQREWAMVIAVDNPQEIGREIAPVKYETKTRGDRKIAEAIPVGEGRYSIILKSESDSRLLYRLSRPQRPGPSQKELGVLPEASFVISVRNPDIDVAGFPDQTPDYPAKIKDKFADERWLAIQDSKLLDYEYTQLVLIGAHSSLDEEKGDVKGEPKMFETLGIDASKWPTSSLEDGEFASAQYKPKAVEAGEERTKGGRKGGKKAAKTASAAGVARSLKGISFPGSGPELAKYAEEHDARDNIIDLLKRLPKNQFDNMADVEKAIGEIR